MNEICWKPIQGYDNYDISDAGAVRRFGRIRRTQVSNSGIVKVVLCRGGIYKTFTIAELVATAFLGNQTEKFVKYLDGNRLNCTASNLAWSATRTQGIQRRVLRNGKLSEDDIRMIRASTKRNGVLAKLVGVTPSTICSIRLGRTWKDVATDVPLEEQRDPLQVCSNKGSRHGRSKLSEADIPRIRNSQSTVTELAREYGVTLACISHIKMRRLWKHVPE